MRHLSVTLWGTIATAFKIALSELTIVTMLGIATLVSLRGAVHDYRCSPES
ncbi:MAG: hypothetical protein MZV63_24775 [Marinilabiliales bacterium]|nr:hypothetical protein [Marinilabiliales bacterium]